MDAGREFHGMQRTPRRTVPPEKGFHLFGHALRRRRDVPCTGDKHVTPNPRAPLTGVAIDLGHGVFSHPPGIPLRGAWLGGV